MGATPAPVKNGGSVSNALSVTKGKLIIMPTLVTGPASYDAGGSVLTQPDDAKGMQLLSVLVAPIVGTVKDRIYGWNGSITAPKLTAQVISTAADVAPTTPLNGDTVPVVFFYEC